MTQKTKPLLKIFCMSQPLLTTEWPSLLSDKFLSALPFEVELTADPDQAEVIAWDGLISPKFERLLPKVQALLSGKILLLMGEAQTLFRHHPFMRVFSTGDHKTVHLPGWSVLPEEVLSALVECYEARKHV